MVVATYKLQVSWNNDADFTDTGDSIDMSRVRGITCSFGRDRASQLTANSRAGTLRAVLDNRSGDYSSFNTSSPLSGKILPGRPVRLLATSASLTDQSIWRGYLTKITPVADRGGDSTAILEATGPLGQVNLDQVAVPMVTSQRTDQVIDDILDAAGWGAGSSYRTMGTGLTTITRYWADRIYTVQALQAIESAEGGFIRESKDGKIIFENRHHRISGARLTSQATYSDAAGASLPYTGVVQDDVFPHIFNIFESDVQTYTTGSVAVLWTLSETGASSPPIIAGVATTYTARYPTAGSATTGGGVGTWTTTAATTDMTANSAADGSGSNLTSSIGISVSKGSETMAVTLTNNGSVTAYITKLQARGTPITSDDPVAIRAEDSTSQTAYGKRTWPSKTRYVPDTGEALDWANFNLSIYKDPTPVLKLTYIANRDQAGLNEMINRDVSDRVTVRANGNANLGLNRDFFVEAISHRIGSDRTHTVSLLLSDAEQFSDWWVWGTSKWGQTTRWAY